MLYLREMVHLKQNRAESKYCTFWSGAFLTTPHTSQKPGFQDSERCLSEQAATRGACAVGLLTQVAHRRNRAVDFICEDHAW